MDDVNPWSWDPNLPGQAPQWAVDMIVDRATKRGEAKPAWNINRVTIPINIAHLSRAFQVWWDGTKFATTPNGALDRSLTLFTIGRMLAKQGMDGPSIVNALADRDEALGYRKYASRRDGGIKNYTDIAQRVLTPYNCSSPTDAQNAGGDRGVGSQPPRDDGRHTDKERRRALVEARMTALYGTRRAYTAQLRQPGDVDLNAPTKGRLSRHGWLHLKKFDDIPILLEDPRLAPVKGELFDLRRLVEPRTARDMEEERDPRGARLVHTCGWDIDATCVEHGVRFCTKRSCRLLDHSLCPTQATERLRVLTLPDAPAGGTYRVVWLALPFGLPDNDGAKAVGEVVDSVTRAVQRVARRKLGAGLLSRSTSLAMARPESVAHIKLLFLDQTAGDSDAAINQVCAALGGTVLGDKNLPTADLAVLQLMEDTMYHLAALESPDPDVYAAWFFGVRNRRLFQSYGLLFGKLAERWVKGETTIVAGTDRAPVGHGLGTQVIVEAQPLGFLPRGWKPKGQVDGRSWEVTASIVKLDRPASQDLTFSWRARQDLTPRCDICGQELTMELQPPSGAEAGNVGGDRWAGRG